MCISTHEYSMCRYLCLCYFCLFECQFSVLSFSSCRPNCSVPLLMVLSFPPGHLLTYSYMLTTLPRGWMTSCKWILNDKMEAVLFHLHHCSKLSPGPFSVRVGNNTIPFTSACNLDYPIMNDMSFYCLIFVIHLMQLFIRAVPSGHKVLYLNSGSKDTGLFAGSFQT